MNRTSTAFLGLDAGLEQLLLAMQENVTNQVRLKYFHVRVAMGGLLHSLLVNNGHDLFAKYVSGGEQ